MVKTLTFVMATRVQSLKKNVNFVMKQERLISMRITNKLDVDFCVTSAKNPIKIQKSSVTTLNANSKLLSNQYS